MHAISLCAIGGVRACGYQGQPGVGAEVYVDIRPSCIDPFP